MVGPPADGCWPVTHPQGVGSENGPPGETRESTSIPQPTNGRPSNTIPNSLAVAACFPSLEITGAMIEVLPTRWAKGYGLEAARDTGGDNV